MEVVATTGSIRRSKLQTNVTTLAPFVRMFNVFMCSFFGLLVFRVFYVYFMYMLVSMCIWHVLNKLNSTTTHWHPTIYGPDALPVAQLSDYCHYYYYCYFWFKQTGLFFGGLLQVRSGPSFVFWRTFGIAGDRFSYMADALPVAQPTVSKHWMNMQLNKYMSTFKIKVYKICQ